MFMVVFGSHYGLLVGGVASFRTAEETLSVVAASTLTQSRFAVRALEKPKRSRVSRAFNNQDREQRAKPGQVAQWAHFLICSPHATCWIRTERPLLLKQMAENLTWRIRDVPFEGYPRYPSCYVTLQTRQTCSELHFFEELAKSLSLNRFSSCSNGTTSCWCHYSNVAARKKRATFTIIWSPGPPITQNLSFFPSTPF